MATRISHPGRLPASAGQPAQQEAAGQTGEPAYTTPDYASIARQFAALSHHMAERARKTGDGRLRHLAERFGRRADEMMDDLCRPVSRPRAGADER
ncbi:hypothetical protein [Azospirillum thermophilum]|uniref:Uncharacterized protein n=1 Tax=Azospirillum thermophilum TaxID=2202148 RepID=A0A2S2CPL4_9PROT|nr:hypothetical protein [Azospirillum thermophilum]AWK86441.1 hypothetical protein DEW08_09495 [Azospirillum thermophilum]